jgi:hypothetical protein
MEQKIEKDVVAMLEVLDNDIVNTQNDIVTLGQLRSYLVKRDERNMLGLLDTIRVVVQNRKDHQDRRFEFRKKLAAALGCAVEKLTLSKLCEYTDEPYKSAIVEKRSKLLAIVERFKTEYEATAYLLSDCARFNSVLLRNLIGMTCASEVTYKPGKINRTNDAAFINAQF